MLFALCHSLYMINCSTAQAQFSIIQNHRLTRRYGFHASREFHMYTIQSMRTDKTRYGILTVTNLGEQLSI